MITSTTRCAPLGQVNKLNRETKMQWSNFFRLNTFMVLVYFKYYSMQWFFLIKKKKKVISYHLSLKQSNSTFKTGAHYDS